MSVHSALKELGVSWFDAAHAVCHRENVRDLGLVQLTGGILAESDVLEGDAVSTGRALCLTFKRRYRP